MGINTATMMLLLVIVSASFAAASSSDNVFMVVDKPMMSSPGGDDVMQYGRFQLPDGKELMLSQRGRVGCVGEGQSCGALHWCCGSLICDDLIKGKCRDGGCSRLGEPCLTKVNYCCDGLVCESFTGGICVNP